MMAPNPMARWRQACSAVLRTGGRLRYLDTEIDRGCVCCGFAFSIPCEAIETAQGLAHTPCVLDGTGVVRGGR